MTHVSFYIDVRLALTWPDQQALFLAPDKVVANRSLILFGAGLHMGK